MMIVQLVLILLIFLVVPYFVGGLAELCLPAWKNSVAFRLLSGYMIAFAVFELLALPALFLKWPMHSLTISYGVVMVVLTAVSLIFCRKCVVTALRETAASFSKIKKQALYILAVGLIVLQVVFVTTHTHIDDDDAFYVGSAETAVVTDTVMEVNPYTGELYDSVPVRYAFSPFMNWNAALSQMTGMKPVTLAHTVMPIFFIMLSYLVYALFGRWLSEKKAINEGLFMLITTVVLGFSGYSVYTQGTFMLTRISQGKALLAACLLPAVLWYALMVIEKGLAKRDMILFFVLMTACSLVSQMGIMLGVIVFGAVMILLAIEKKSLRPIIFAIPCCLVNIICSAAYVLMR
ncbi:MAG: DUF6077 domain-containing protein [Lachnospiraceae bacterium]|nr:DUF6077 domain-containing protein [Lachnospiraceae bacterium]